MPKTGGRAPEFKDIAKWINSKPLKMRDLEGKVVIIDFWAYSCINCRRTIPYLKRWHEKYRKKGLVIVGVHSPEFTFEKNENNLKKAVKELKIEYPVAADNNMRTWYAYDNMHWPAKYMIDRDGYIIFNHFGEGGYVQTEKQIQKLLGIKVKTEKEDYPGYLFYQSPETYAGFERSMGLGSGLACDDKGCRLYIDPGNHMPNTIYPNGQWEQKRECLELKKPPGQISYRFMAREANLVMAPVKEKVNAQIFIDDRKKAEVKIDKATIYTLHTSRKYKEHELVINFNGRVRVYAFTFG